MIQFLWPWVFYCLPLPLIVWWLWPPAPVTIGDTLRVPFAEDFVAVNANQGRSRRANAWFLLAAIIAWLLLLTAAARPQWLGQQVALPISGRDLLLAVDLSGSMDVEDFILGGRTVNRLQATKAVAGEFIERRLGDRLGLILFGSQAYSQTPLTFDRVTVRTLLEEATIGMAGQETAMGDAIGLAVKRLKNTEAKDQVLILLTDGVNTAGDVTPLKAAEIAAQYGLKIYTIGIGADEMLVQTLFGRRRINPSQDLDEETLTAIAKVTGGRYFRAHNSDELNKIYQLLDTLEPVERETRHFRPVRALYMWPLGTAFVLSGLFMLAHLAKGWRYKKDNVE